MSKKTTHPSESSGLNTGITYNYVAGFNFKGYGTI